METPIPAMIFSLYFSGGVREANVVVSVNKLRLSGALRGICRLVAVLGLLSPAHCTESFKLLLHVLEQLSVLPTILDIGCRFKMVEAIIFWTCCMLAWWREVVVAPLCMLHAPARRTVLVASCDACSNRTVRRSLKPCWCLSYSMRRWILVGSGGTGMLRALKSCWRLLTPCWRSSFNTVEDSQRIVVCWRLIVRLFDRLPILAFSLGIVFLHLPRTPQRLHLPLQLPDHPHILPSLVLQHL